MADLVGVRFPAERRVHYYRAAARLAVGDRVVAPTADGPRLGRVVIAPDQVVLNELPDLPPAVAHPATPGDVASLGPSPRIGDATRATESVAGGAVSPPGQSDLLDLATLPALGTPERPAGIAARLAARLDARSRDYLVRKYALPALGQEVATDAGPGRVVAVDVRDERVTIVLDAGPTVERIGPALAPPDPDAPDRRRRRGRGARPSPPAAKE